MALVAPVRADIYFYAERAFLVAAPQLAISFRDVFVLLADLPKVNTPRAEAEAEAACAEDERFVKFEDPKLLEVATLRLSLAIIY